MFLARSSADMVVLSWSELSQPAESAKNIPSGQPCLEMGQLVWFAHFGPDTDAELEEEIDICPWASPHRQTAAIQSPVFILA